MDLSIAERWILFNQFEILARLDPDHEADHRRAQKVITRGYTTAYPWYTDFLIPEVPRETCQEVMDVLDMFRAIQQAHTDPSDVAGVEDWELEFSGFDGNKESEYVSFALFLIKDEGRWPMHADAGDRLNSHMPTLDRYRRMLKRWKAMGEDRWKLSEDHLRELAKAGRRPKES